jgi:hypothetical protein
VVPTPKERLGSPERTSGVVDGSNEISWLKS